MAAAHNTRRLLGGKHARLLTAALLLQAALFYTLSHGEAVPNPRSLSGFPARLDQWVLAKEGVVEREILDVLRADDVLNRVYRNGSSGEIANLFVAYFKTQRTGQAPHSPKNCLPGSGWVPSVSEIVLLDIPGRTEPIDVNRYIVSRGEESSLVLYWYQTRDRAIASEYKAKIFLVLDSIRYNRSDTAMVRVVVPVREGDTERAAETAGEFVRAFFQPLRAYLPG